MFVSFAPSGLACICGLLTHGLRRGLHSVAASRLQYVARFPASQYDGAALKRRSSTVLPALVPRLALVPLPALVPRLASTPRCGMFLSARSA